MATPTSVDQTVQRDQPLPDQADTPGSTHTQDLAGETPGILHLSYSSSSPHTSSAEDSPQEASSSASSDYDSDSSEEEFPTTARSEARLKEIIADSDNREAAVKRDTCWSDDEGDNNMPEGMALVGVPEAEPECRVTEE